MDDRFKTLEKYNLWGGNDFPTGYKMCIRDRGIAKRGRGCRTCGRQDSRIGEIESSKRPFFGRPRYTCLLYTSIQMFTALKLLGKPTAFVQVEGENHHILDYDKRILWNNTIYAWFAKWLKDQPEWWNALYPPKSL